MNSLLRIKRTLNTKAGIVKQNIEVIILFIFSVICYMPIIFGNGKLTNPDSIWIGIYQQVNIGNSREISLGRFGIHIFDTLRNYINWPSAELLMTLLILAFIHYTVLKIFDIKSGLSKCICGVIIYFSFSINALVTYFYCIDAYVFSYLICVIAAYFLAKKTGKIYFGSSVLLLAFSLSLYQAYFFCAVTLCLIYMISILPNVVNRRKYVLHGLKMISALFLGAGLYLLLAKYAVPLFTSIPLASNRGFNEMGSIAISSMPELLKKCFLAFYNYNFASSFTSNNWMFKGIIRLFIYSITFIVWMIKIYHSHDDYHYLVYGLVEFLLLPIAMFGITVTASKVNIYGSTGFLMTPAAAYALFIPAIILDKYSNSICSIILRVSLVYLSVLSVITTTVFQYCLYLNYQKGSAFALDLLSSVNKIQNYDSIFISGTLLKNECYTKASEKQYYSIVKGTVAEYAITWNDPTAIENGWMHFFQTFTNSELIFRIDDPIGFYNDNQEMIKSMTCYPDSGSILLIEDVLVIKLSN